MKRIIVALLLAALLCGCGLGDIQPEETVPVTEQPTVFAEPTEPAGFYVPESGLELSTGGAVRTYVPEDGTSYAIEVLDGDVLVFSGEDKTTLTRLTGDNLYPIAQTQLSCLVYPEDSSFCFSEKGVTYFDDREAVLVFLDDDLREVNRVKLPEGIQGTPVLSANRLKLFYCTADAVRVLDLETGLDRLLKQMNYSYQAVAGTLFHDTVLQCVLDDGGAYTIFLSTETGELLDIPRENLQVTGAGERFYGILSGGSMDEFVFGTGRDDVQLLTPADPFGSIWCMENVSAVTMVYGTETAASFAYYDLETGRRTASLELPGAFYPWCIQSCPGKDYVYILGYDPAENCPAICRWELEQSAVSDETVYTGSWYTLENPDRIGLDQCQKRAEALELIYGVKVLIGEDAVKVEPWDYALEPEYHVPVISRDLDRLEQYLSIFPEDFFETMGEDIRICLVRSLRGTAESGSLESADGIQFWDEGRAYVALAEGDNLEMTLYHELFHLIDNHVLSACYAYYDWDRLNPQGFSYDYSYLSYQNRDPETYLDDATRAFIDTYSMTYPKEDRARVMEYACTAGHESYFASETMQNKLRTLCQGIRTAFNLKDYEGVLLWEQYLLDPLTK